VNLRKHCSEKKVDCAQAGIPNQDIGNGSSEYEYYIRVLLNHENKQEGQKYASREMVQLRERKKWRAISRI